MLTLSIHNKKDEMAGLESFLEQVSDTFAIDPGTSFQLNLALDEALANSVNYAYPEGTDGIVTLEADKINNQIVFRLIDAGKPFDPTKEAKEVDTTLSAEERPIGGLGIFLINQMMDSVTYERKDGQNILTMCKNC